ncbi:unnamed protein product [Spirodela intermedia]|uniref:Uncharacterized protein n=1 Tax=Spirodela intermedia TaxID=51605 RepID=A0A7I8LA80_SPIIN|nr:unnamed protein product [Spirodela intermedia]
MKSDFSNENKVIILLIFLLDSYDHLVMTLLHNSTSLVFKDVINLLMKYYHRKKNVGKTHDESLYVKGERKHRKYKEKKSSEDNNN